MADGSERRGRELKRKLFYALVGECITAWAAVEHQLFYLFAQALFGVVADGEKAALLFWTFPNFGMRLSYTSMLVKHCLRTGQGKKTDAQKYWKELNDEIKELSSFRNLVAHQPIAPDKIVPAFDEKYYTVLTWVDEMIIPNELDAKKTFNPIKEVDLEAHLKSLSQVREKLKHVSVNLQHWKEIAQETFSDNESI